MIDDLFSSHVIVDYLLSSHVISVVELPLFWAAPAPEVRGPGADSGSDRIGSAPAPAQGKNRRLLLHALKFLILSS